MDRTTIRFNTITADQQNKLQDVYLLMSHLRTFKIKANQSLMKYLFGEERATHHIIQFSEIKDITQWINQLSADEKGIVLANIYYNDTLYAHC